MELAVAIIIGVLGLTGMVFMFVNKMVKNHCDQKTELLKRKFLNWKLRNKKIM